MQAMILAAGLGTRLLPLTQRRPKCLMPVMNQPLLGLWLAQLAARGVLRAAVNTHHLAPQVREFLARETPAGLLVHESHEPTILGTGGGLVRLRDFWGSEPFLLVNADVLAEDDPGPLLAELRRRRAVACLGLVDWPQVNSVAVDDQGLVRGFRDQAPSGAGLNWLTYSGLAAISPELLNFLPKSGYSSLVDGLKAALAAGRPVLGRRLTGYWNDLGAPARLLAAHRRLFRDPPPGLAGLAAAGATLLAPGVSLPPSVAVRGFLAAESGAVVGPEAEVAEVVMLRNAVIAPGARVRATVLGEGAVARGELVGEALG
ncbi:MAG: nucleotidyltransferase family protein [Deltaproteobacteria bacterium]|nr:nucleotidyltransferase family protein [Deltaproteobacteria bacterium]